MGKPMRVVVTGGAGYIGTRLIERMVRKHDPVVFDPGVYGFRSPVFHNQEVVLVSGYLDLPISPNLVQFADAVIHLGGYCLTSDTEVLSRRGWMLHDALSETDELATVNQQTGELEYQRPTEILRFEYDGPIHEWRTEQVDFSCTPNHRLWLRSRGCAWRFEESRGAATRNRMQWMVGGARYHGRVERIVLPIVPYGQTGRTGFVPPAGGWLVTDFAPYLGYYLAEGCTQRCSGFRVAVSQNPGPIAEQIADSIRRLGVEPHVYTGRLADGDPHAVYMVFSKSLAVWLDREVGVGARNKRIPPVVFEWIPKAQEALLDAYLEGDGRRREAGDCRIAYTASCGLADDLQRLGIQLGYRATKRQRKDGDYEVSFVPRGWTDVFGEDAIVASYRGTTWCVQVPNQLFVTRRNGKIAIHGNSNDPTAEFSPERTRTVNVEGTRNLIRACEEAEVPRFILASSASLYDRNGGSTEILDETAEVTPLSTYSASKVESEQLLFDSKIPCPIALRKGTVYGWSPRMRWDLVVNSMVRDALVDGVIRIAAGGRMWRPLVHIEDVVSAYLHVLELPEEEARGQAFNVVGGNHLISEVADVVHGVCTEYGRHTEIVSIPSAGKVRDYRISGSKLRQTGWTSRYGIFEGASTVYREAAGKSRKELLSPDGENIAWLKLASTFDELLARGFRP